jgi:hypothetical protein
MLCRPSASCLVACDVRQSLQVASMDMWRVCVLVPLHGVRLRAEGDVPSLVKVSWDVKFEKLV